MTIPPDLRKALAAAFRERLAVIADRAFYQRDPAGHLAKLQEVSAAITSLSAQLPAGIDPQFTHYLQRASYDKALAYLEGQ
jgi:hypothetical protein